VHSTRTAGVIVKAIRRLSVLLFASFFCLPLLSQSATAAGAVSRITAPVDESSRVALQGNVHPMAQARFDRGEAPSSMATGRVTLVLQRSVAQQQALMQYLGDVQNPSSPSYHKWLTPAQYGAAYGVSDSDLQTVETWLQSHGLKIEKVPLARNAIQFSGTTGQIESAFQTSIHAFSIGGATDYANVSDPEIPAALAPVIAGMTPLNDFHPKAHLVPGTGGTYDAGSHTIQPNLTLFSGSTPILFVDPADAATIYDTPNTSLNANFTSGTTYDGTGVNLGIVGVSDLTVTDVENYRLAFLGETSTTANLPTVVVDGDDPGLNGAGVEALLDAEVSGGIAPKAKLYFYTSADTDLTSGLYNAIVRAIDDNAVSILSMSFGECETGLGTGGNNFMLEEAQQAAAQGISFVVSAGDGGSAGCDDFDTQTQAQYGLAVSGMASTPWTIAVGGTDFDGLPQSFATYASDTSNGTAPYYRTALRYIPENPWNDSTSVDTTFANNVRYLNSQGSGNIVAGSGGVSSVYSKPAFQTSLTLNDNVRDVPDVSFFASNGFKQAVWVICSDNVTDGNPADAFTDCQTSGGQLANGATVEGVGGTSASAPAFAGMLALVAQSQGGARLGQADTVLYQLAKSKYATVFHDVTAGNNSVPCMSGSLNCGANGFLTGYNAGTGYDLATGLGSLDVKQMIANWTSVALTSTSTTLELNGSAAAYSGVHGASVAFNVGVTPTAATGAVAVIDTANQTAGGTVSGPQNNGQLSIPLTSGAGTASYNGLPGGTYMVSARYGGDTSDASSSSTPISVTIAPEASTTTLQVNAYNALTGNALSTSSVPYGSVVLLDGHIEGTAEGANTEGAATGTVTFANGSTTLGTASISASANLASYPTLSKPWIPAAGSYSFMASYPGDASYKSSTSVAVPFTIAKGITATAIPYPPGNIFGTNLATGMGFSVTTPYNLGVAPTGSVVLTINGTTAATVSNLAATTNSITNPTLYVLDSSGTIPGNLFNQGPNTVTTTYSGDSNYAGSSTTTTVNDTNGVGSLALTNSGDVAIIAGQYAYVTVTVSPSGGFYSSVSLTESSLPSGVALTGNTTLGIVSAQPVSTTLYLQTPYALVPGTYPVTLTAKDAIGRITASTTFNVVVSGTPANAGISLTNGGALTIGAGSQINAGTVTLTPTDGFVGQVNFTCAITTAMSNVTGTPTCQGFLQGFPTSTPGTFQIPITTYDTTTAGAYTVTVTATDVNDSAITATTTIPLTITAFDGVLISINPFTITVGAGATSGNTLSMTLTPSGGYTGTVNLSCVSLTEPPSAVSPVSCLVPSSLNISSANPVTATLTANTTQNTTLGTYNFGVNVSDAATGVHESGTDISVMVQAGPGLALTNSGGITVTTPGATSGDTSTITVTPANGFTGQINLSCALTSSPSGASDLPTCSVPASISVTGTTAVTATLTVNTTAATSGALDLPLRKFFMAGGGGVLALVLLFGIPARQRAWRGLFGLVALLAVFGAIGCGGGGGGGGTPPPPPNNPGTTAGAYTVTVTGTDAATGKITSSVAVAVTVN
jgi:hypothetical protein